MSEADYTGSEEESPLSYDSDNIDKDMDELITITRRTRKRDTSTAFSPVKEDDRKACDHTPSLDHDTERTLNSLIICIYIHPDSYT